MKINIIEPIGVCDGVLHALSEITRIRILKKNKNIYLFGPLIHNENINKYFRSLKIDIIETKGLNEETKKLLLSSYNNDDVIVFQAHGTKNLYKEILEKNGVEYFDLTCPIIKATKNLILNSLNNEENEVVFVGKKEHDETISIMDLSKDSLFLYDIKNGFINDLEPKGDNIDIYFQSTLSITDFEYFCNFFKEKYKNIHIKNDICPKIRIRQEKIIHDFETNPNLVIVVGSETSSNTNELFKIASNKYHNAIVKRINSIEEIEDFDFSNIKEINVISGTSALNETVNSIVDFLKTK